MKNKLVGMLEVTYPEWKKVAWRWLRTSLAGGLSIVLLLQPDWSRPGEALRVIGTAFIGGFITSMAMKLRDSLSEGDKTTLVNKIPL
jgi:hypothetical protein